MRMNPSKKEGRDYVEKEKISEEVVLGKKVHFKVTLMMVPLPKLYDKKQALHKPLLIF